MDVERGALSVATVVPVGVRTSVPARAIRHLTLVLLAAAIAAMMPSAVSAQTPNTLQSISPADGATLAESPTVITLAFNQELADDDAVTVVLACNNNPSATGLPDVDDEGLVVTVPVPAPLPKGVCTISWSLKDGLGATILSDFLSFSVTSDPPPSVTGADSGVAATTSPFINVPAVGAAPSSEITENAGSSGGALWLGRLMSTLGILVLFGALTLISVGWPEGPEYVVTVRFMRTVWMIGLIGTILYLIAYSADYSGSSFGSAMSPSTWLDLKDDGWTGRGALLRLAFVAASGWVAMRPERIIDPASAMWAWALPGAAVITIAFSRIGGPVAAIGFLVGAVHALSVAVWIGGVALVARVILAGPGDDDLVQATRTFSRFSVPAILIACVTGIIQVIRLVGNSFFSSGHGQVLMLKVIAVAVMLAVGLAVRQQVTMRLDRAQELTVQTADRFRRAFGAEAALGVVVLAFSGWMLALTPAKVDPLAGEDYELTVTFDDTLTTGIKADVLIGPSEVGANGIRVEVSAPAEGITNLVLRFTPPVDTTARIIEQTIPLTGAGTAVLLNQFGLPFDAPGTWTIEMIASTATGTQPGARTTFAVTAAGGSTASIPAASTTVPVAIQLIDQSTTSAPFATPAPTTTTTSMPTSAPPSG